MQTIADYMLCNLIRAYNINLKTLKILRAYRGIFACNMRDFSLTGWELGNFFAHIKAPYLERFQITSVALSNKIAPLFCRRER